MTTNNQNHPAMTSIDELRAGDVLLCYEDGEKDFVGNRITAVTGSEYTHAAICIDSFNAAEAMFLGGVTKVKISDIIKRYDHIAVFRQPDAWCHDDRVEAINLFIDSLVVSGAKYNVLGIKEFKEKRDNHILNSYEKLTAFFNDPSSKTAGENKKYFCSELVADCFIVSGFIEPTAAVVYQSDVTSPGALGRDPTYGTFYGYISGIPNYTVPRSDEFFNTTTYKEIFGLEE